ncbi:transcription factor Spi-C isoform X1 [Paramormyrops kingsleyae]|uniref:transcription factor Spi-C isoform X1 n=1 Tax=Paramormyrops kingsleyae TaxID=1676925 RepID=UPI003B974CF6
MLEYQLIVFWKLLCAELHCCLSSDIIIDGLCDVPAASIQNDLDQDHFNQEFQDAIDVIQRHSSELQFEPDKYYETLEAPVSARQPGGPCYPHNPGPSAPGHAYDWGEQPPQPWGITLQETSNSSSTPCEVPQIYPVFPSQRNGKGRKKLRLYEYLHEALHDASMADSIQWADRSNGTFHFVSKNKERLAESWGKRKGNRKTMTYQKMARALRNYSRTGEIVKIRRKLTYQFNPLILQRLSLGHTQCHAPGHAPGHAPVHPPRDVSHHQCAPTEQVYYDTLPPDFHGWYGHYPCDNDYDLTLRLG